MRRPVRFADELDCFNDARDRCVFRFLRQQRHPRATIAEKRGRRNDDRKTVNALSRIDSAGGKVFIEGENWNAVSETPVEAGQPVEIIGIEGLTLKVKPASRIMDQTNKCQPKTGESQQ